MKKYFRLFILVIVVLNISGCGQFNARSAVKVNDEIVAVHKKLMSSLEAFINALDERDKEDIENSLSSLKLMADAGLKTAEDQVAVRCNSTFLPAAEEMFQFYSNAADEDYAAIAGFYSMDSISYSEYDSLQLMIQHVESAQKQIDRAFLDAQQSFARSCGFKLVRNVE